VHVRIRLFAGLRDRAGRDAVELELPAGALVADALAELRWLTSGTSVVMAVNREYADAGTVLSPGDELALIPPVSGGAQAAVAHARIVGEPLSAQALLELVADPRAGAVVSFSGVTREVPALEYEAYAEMAETKLLAIVTEAIERHGLCASGRHGPAVGALGRDRRVGPAPRRGVRRRPRDHRPHQARGADLEARGRRVGRGPDPRHGHAPLDCPACQLVS